MFCINTLLTQCKAVPPKFCGFLEEEDFIGVSHFWNITRMGYFDARLALGNPPVRSSTLTLWTSTIHSMPLYPIRLTVSPPKCLQSAWHSARGPYTHLTPLPRPLPPLTPHLLTHCLTLPLTFCFVTNHHHPHWPSTPKMYIKKLERFWFSTC